MTSRPEDTAAVPALEARGLDVRYPRATASAVSNVSLSIAHGSITAIIGANGSGKSTLLRALGRLSAPTGGVVLLDGRDIATLPAREVARGLGILPQAPVAPEGLTVGDLVSRGRDPHRRWFEQWSRADEAVVREALAQTGMESMADSRIDELSGGQRQRAWIAMALAQQTGVLLLDEPTTYLDLVHQLDVLDVVAGLHRDAGVTVVMVLHDLTMAARYADRIIAMRDGAVAADGTAQEVITPGTLVEVFDLDADVVTDAAGRPVVIPLRRAGAGGGTGRPV
jgi:iron complex transport system ATP-binding protein